MLLIGWAAAFAACSTQEGSERAGGSSAVAAQSAGTPARASGSEAPAKPETGTRSGGRRLDSDELVGLGELGLLPSLLQTLGTGIDCDFDDALSTCQ